MKRLFALICAMTIVGCSAEQGNPLSNKDPAEIVSALKQRHALRSEIRENINLCAVYWVESIDPQVPATEDALCSATADQISADLKDLGYGNIQVQDVYHPALWAEWIASRYDEYDNEALKGVIR